MRERERDGANLGKDTRPCRAVDREPLEPRCERGRIVRVALGREVPSLTAVPTERRTRDDERLTNVILERRQERHVDGGHVGEVGI